MAANKLTADAIRDLASLTTKNESGQHFTEYSMHWEELEAHGLIRVIRPVHQGTSIPYSQEYWTLEVTDYGRDAVED